MSVSLFHLTLHYSFDHKPGSETRLNSLTLGKRSISPDYYYKPLRVAQSKGSAKKVNDESRELVVQAENACPRG